MAYSQPIASYFKMPMQPSTAFLQGLNEEQQRQLERKIAEEKIQASKAETGLRQSEMGLKQSEMEMKQQMMPYDIEKLQADIEKVRGETSLYPAHKQLLMAQAIRAAKESQMAGAEAKSPLGKLLEDAKNTTDPMERQMYLKSAQSMMLSPEEKQAEMARAKDWSKMETDDRALANGANKTLQALSSFNSAAEKVPHYFKGAFYVPDTDKSALGGLAKRIATAQSGASYGAAEKYQAQLQLFQQALVRNGSRMNINLLQTLNKSTVGLGLTDEARKEVSNSIEMGARLAQEKVKFNNELKRNGITDPQVADELWSTYNDNYPVVSDNNKPIKENLNKWKSVVNDYIGGEKSEGEGEGMGESGFSHKTLGNVTQKELEDTAKKYNITVDQVKKRIGLE